MRRKTRRIVISRRMPNTRRMVKTWCMLNTWRMVKTWRMPKTWRMVKTWRMLKTWRPQNLCCLVKHWCPKKCWRSRKSRRSRSRTPYCLGSAESATADLSLVPLISMFASLLMLNRVHVVSKWGMSSPGPAFMGELSPVPGYLYRPAMLRNGQIFGVSQIFGVRLKFHWFQSNHSSLYLCL